jgi:hypothetical protein
MPPCRQAGFDFTSHVRRLCEEMVARLPELSHVQMRHVAVGFSQARSASLYGIYATLAPMRFPGGSLETFRRGRRYGIRRLYDPSGTEMFYILSFYLPRFLDLSFRQKLTTTAHELWHISPQFDGDVRRYEGRCYAHSGSKRRFDELAQTLAERYLATEPPEEAHAFLREDYRGLVARHGRVFGLKIAAPKLVPL